MNFDFAKLLCFLTLASGLIWAVDVFWFMPRRQGEVNQETEKLSFLGEYAKSLFPVFLIVLILRSFLFEPFKIPSGSMMPTLLIGDFILVNKHSYGLKLPVLNTKIFNVDLPQRGDIVVFRYPKDPNVPFVKRVIGLPGDKIDYIDKSLYINGDLIPQSYLQAYDPIGAGIMMQGAILKNEILGEIMHDILIEPDKPMFDAIEGLIVPDGHYFVLGDNRDNSRDSRFWGFVPEQNLVGKALIIWMNWDMKNKGIIEFSRIGTKLI